MLTAQVTADQPYELSRLMTIKNIHSLIVFIAVLTTVCVPAHAEREQKIYPLPVTETEDVIVQWFHRAGHHLRRLDTDDHRVHLFARKKGRFCHVTLHPYSPLATKVAAMCTLNGGADPTGIQSFWSLLGEHVEAISTPTADATRKMPDAVLSNAGAVVCIYVDYPENPLQISGFIIDKKGLIICTAHGLKSRDQMLTVTLRDGRELQGRVVKIDKRHDLTLVDVRTGLDDAIPLSGGRDLAGQKERLFNIVCAAQSGDPLHSGTVSGPPRKSDDQLLWQVNMQIRPGSSGSPVFDLRGHLVAMVKGRYRGAEKVGFLIPFATLLKFMSGDSR